MGTETRPKIKKPFHVEAGMKSSFFDEEGRGYLEPPFRTIQACQ
jgi:hypothetical protein